MHVHVRKNLNSLVRRDVWQRAPRHPRESVFAPGPSRKREVAVPPAEGLLVVFHRCGLPAGRALPPPMIPSQLESGCLATADWLAGNRSTASSNSIANGPVAPNGSSTALVDYPAGDPISQAPTDSRNPWQRSSTSSEDRSGTRLVWR